LKFLVITVGGSCAPILTSIRQNKPDKIFFICSDDTETSRGSYRTVEGSGNVCGLDEPNILTQAGVPEVEYDIIKITDFDDLNSCYTLL